MGEKSNSELMDELLTEMEAMLPQLEAHVERLEKAFAKLEADNKRLREALVYIAYEAGQYADGAEDAHYLAKEMTVFESKARAALKETEDDPA